MADLLNLKYQKILDISRRMQQAGEAQQWDLLLDLEKQRQGLFSDLPDNIVGRISGGGSDSLVETLKEIQECDKALMDKVGNWLQHARILLRIPPESDVSS